MERLTGINQLQAVVVKLKGKQSDFFAVVEQNSTFKGYRVNFFVCKTKW